MITLRDRQTQNLFDPWEFLGQKRRNLLDRCWAGIFRNYLLAHLPASKLSNRLTKSHGRPSKDLHVVLGALVLQQLHDLTDLQTVEAVAFNISWHYALDIHDISDSYICERTLRNYRQWVIEKELDGELFEGLTDKLIKAFSIDTDHQRIDSTGVQSAMKTMTRLGILVATITKFLKELACRQPDFYAQVDQVTVDRFIKREGKCFGFGRPSEAKQQLPDVAQIMASLVYDYRNTDAANLDSYQLMARVFTEQCNQSIAGGKVDVKAPSDIPSDTVQNPSDPDASFNAHRGRGYLVQVVETYSPDQPTHSSLDLITYVDVQKMTQHDSKALEPAMASLSARQIKPKEILGDSHYGVTENVKRLASEGVDVVSPAAPPKGYKQGRLSLEDFELDDQGVVLSCPAGQAPVNTYIGKSKIEVIFDQSICSQCTNRQHCPGYSKREGRLTQRWQYTNERVAQYRRRCKEKLDCFKKAYRWRAGVEATMSRLKHQMNLSSLRVRGKVSVQYAVFLRALGLNIMRVAACSQ